MKLTVDGGDVHAVSQALVQRFSERRMNSAIATALTRAAIDVRDEAKAEMRRVFDRPTPYTLDSVFVRPAKPDRLEAVVEIKDDRGVTNGGTPATRYLLPQVHGGQRRLKRLEVALQAAGVLPQGWYVVPGAAARLDAYGNVSRGQVVQVLSQLRIQLVAGSSRNMSFDARKRIRAEQRAGGRYFVIKPGSRARAQPGVWQREWFVRGASPIFIFVNRAQYAPRFDFYGLAQRVAQERLPAQLQQAISESASRLAAKA